MAQESWTGVYRNTHLPALSGYMPNYILTYVHTGTRIYLIILGRTAVPFVSLSIDFVQVVMSSKVDSLSFTYILIV